MGSGVETEIVENRFENFSGRLRKRLKKVR